MSDNLEETVTGCTCGPAALVMFLIASLAVFGLTVLYGYVALFLSSVILGAGGTFGIALMWWAKPWESEYGSLSQKDK